MKSILAAMCFCLASAVNAAAETAHDVALEMVRPGQEGLELSARLSPEGGLIARPIAWAIATAQGEPVYSGLAATTRVKLSPGDYVVNLAYGAVSLSRDLTVVGGTYLSVSLVLDAGGIRLVPDAAEDVATDARIYALSGARKGELVAASRQPGELMNLPKGAYRIEISAADGRIVAMRDIQVKPGRTSVVTW